MEKIINDINYRFEEEAQTAEVIKRREGIYNDYGDEIIIPETVVLNDVTYRVTRIGEKAFSCCESLKSITIPNSIKSIGEDAFNGCSALTAIEVAKGNTVYDSRENCNALIHTATNTLIRGCQNTTIPNSVTTIGKNAFHDCHSLKSIIISKSVTTIEEIAFCNCFSLKYIAFTDSIKTIGKSAFYRCESLKSIIIPDSIKTISWGAFNQCKSLKAIVIPDSVTNIEDHAFEDCESLKYIVIPDSVVNIGYHAFDGCKSLYEIHYDGTKAQWIKIIEDEIFCAWSHPWFVSCTDGHIEI